MGYLGALPALSVERPENILETYGRALALQNLGLQNQQQQQQLNDQRTYTAALKQSNGDWETMKQAYFDAGGSGMGWAGVENQRIAYQQKLSDIRKADAETGSKQFELLQQKNDAFAGHLDALKGVSDDELPDALLRETNAAVVNGTLDDQGAAGIKRIVDLNRSNPSELRDQINIFENRLLLHSQQINEADKRVTALARTTPEGAAALSATGLVPNIPQVGKTAPLSDAQIQNLNEAMQDRYQVLNPGKALPAYLNLATGATQDDFNRIDKILQQTEQARGTKAQQDTANAIREQTLRMTQQRQDESQEKQGLKWVSYTDPQTGRQVAGPISQAKAAGATDMAELGQKDVNEIREARNVHQILAKQGTPDRPESMGVLQLIDSLDKDGKLGVLTSRLNDFLAGKVGTLPGDDPRIATLLNKADLAMTASMKAHFGASGGRSPQMLEHFLQMANARKMDAGALRAGFNAIDDYMQDRGMMQSSPGSSGAGGSPSASKPKAPTFADWKANRSN